MVDPDPVLLLKLDPILPSLPSNLQCFFSPFHFGEKLPSHFFSLPSRLFILQGIAVPPLTLASLGVEWGTRAAGSPWGNFVSYAH